MVRLLSVIFAALMVLGATASATDKNKSKTNLAPAQNTVDRVRLPDPPRVSTSTTRSPSAAEIAAQQNAAERARQRGGADLKTPPPPPPKK
jgi:hypothetical protein